MSLVCYGVLRCVTLPPDGGFFVLPVCVCVTGSYWARNTHHRSRVVSVLVNVWFVDFEGRRGKSELLQRVTFLWFVWICFGVVSSGR